MYFDARLWRLTRGLRPGMLLGVVLGLLALAAGIARFAFLGVALARVFAGEGLVGAAWPLAGVRRGYSAWDTAPPTSVAGAFR